MGQVGTNGILVVGLKQFDDSFSGSGVDVSLLQSLSFNSSLQIEYEVVSNQQLGVASIKPDFNSQLVRSTGNFLQSNDQLLHQHMFDPDDDFGLPTGGDTYLFSEASFLDLAPILNDSVVDDTLNPGVGSGGATLNQVSHLLGYLPQSSSFSEAVCWGGGLNLLNTNPNPNGFDIAFSIFVDTIPPPANRVKSADTDPVGYLGAMPSQLQPWNTAGSDFHSPQTVAGNPNFQSPVGAQGSLGYIVFWTDPISLDNGFDGAPLESGEYHFTSYNSSLVYAGATAQYQSYLGGLRQASISVPAGHFVKAGIIPFYTANATQVYLDNVINPQSSGQTPDFGVAFNGSPNGSPLATRFTVSVTNAENPQVFNGQIMHASFESGVEVLANGFSGPTNSPPPPASTPPPQESRSSVNSSSGSSVLTSSNSDSQEYGSLSIHPSKASRAKLRSAKNKSKKKSR